MVSDVRKVRELQYRFVSARNTKMFVDHVGDLSSSKKSIDFLGFLLFSVDLLLKFACSSRSSFKSLRSWRPVSRSWDEVSLWLKSTCSNRPYSELPQFRKPTTWHQMDGKTRNTLLLFFFLKNLLYIGCKLQVWDISRIPICLSLHERNITRWTFLEVRM